MRTAITVTGPAPKAKELRGHVERTISIGVRLGDLLDKPKHQRTREEQARYAHAMAQAAKTIRDRDVLHKLFEDIAPRVRARPGGFTRIVRLGMRRVGDDADMAVIELVDPAPAAVEASAEARGSRSTRALTPNKARVGWRGPCAFCVSPISGKLGRMSEATSPWLDRSVADFELSVRSRANLQRAGITSIRQLVGLSVFELSALKFDKASSSELEGWLTDVALSLRS